MLTPAWAIEKGNRNTSCDQRSRVAWVNSSVRNNGYRLGKLSLGVSMTDVQSRVSSVYGSWGKEGCWQAGLRCGICDDGVRGRKSL